MTFKIGADIMQQNNSREHALLKISVYGAIIFSVTGIVIGLLVGAQMILFDGLYSLVSLGLSILSLIAARFISKHDINNYPFGKDKIEPLVVLIKYFVILVLVIASLISALMALASGGREVAVGIALIYSTLATVLCIGITYYLKKEANKVRSALLQAEANQWYMDTLVSVAVLIGFVISYLLNLFITTQFIVPFIDPIMVIAVSIYFIKVPIEEMSTALREILDMPPKGKMPDQIKQFIKVLARERDFDETIVRITKVGKTLWVEIDFVIKKEELASLTDQDQIREAIDRYLDQYPYQKWLTVSFTKDRKWAL